MKADERRQATSVFHERRQRDDLMDFGVGGWALMKVGGSTLRFMRDVRVASRKERSLGGETAKLYPRPASV